MNKDDIAKAAYRLGILDVILKMAAEGGMPIPGLYRDAFLEERAILAEQLEASGIHVPTFALPIPTFVDVEIIVLDGEFMDEDTNNETILQ